MKLVNNEEDYLKCTSKPSYILHKVFDNNLVAIPKSKLTLKLNKPADIGMCILELNKCTNSIMIILKINMTTNQSYDLTKSKYYDDLNKLVIGKMKDETRGIAIQEFVGLKPKMYSFLVDNNEYKKAKGLNKHFVATISDILLNNKCIRHSMNRIQSKGHRMGTY